MVGTRIKKILSAVLISFCVGSTALAGGRSCSILSEGVGWSLVEKAESLEGDPFVEAVLSVIDLAHPYSLRRYFGTFRFSNTVLARPSSLGPSLTLLAQLSHLQQTAKTKNLNQKQIDKIRAHIVAALNSFGGNGLGRHTGLWILSNRTPLGILEERIKDLQNKEHDYLVFAYRDWSASPQSGRYTLDELRMQIEFTAARKYSKEKFELYIEAIEKAAASQNEENYMTFAAILAASLQQELRYSTSQSLSTPRIIAILNTLRSHASNYFFTEGTLSYGKGFALVQTTLLTGGAPVLWRDTQTKQFVEQFVADWRQEIVERMHLVKEQYLLRLRPMSEDEVVALKPKFQKKLAAN